MQRKAGKAAGLKVEVKSIDNPRVETEERLLTRLKSAGEKETLRFDKEQKIWCNKFITRPGEKGC